MAVQDEETLMLKAPKDSQNMRAAEKGVAQSIHKFSFSKVREQYITFRICDYWCWKKGELEGDKLFPKDSIYFFTKQN